MMHSLCTHQATGIPHLLRMPAVISGAVTEWTSGTAEVTKDGTYTVSLSNIKGTGTDEETGEETLLPAACVFRQTYAASYILRSALTLLTVHGL